MVEGRNHQQRNKSGHGKGHDDFLGLLLFRGWSQLHAPLKKLRVL